MSIEDCVHLDVPDMSGPNAQEEVAGRGTIAPLHMSTPARRRIMSSERFRTISREVTTS